MSGTGEATYGVEIIARLLNITPRRVQQLAKEGVIPKASRGKYSLAASVTGYVGYLQKQIENPKNQGKMNLTAERARKTAADADIAEMEAEKMRGTLVDAGEMKEMLAAVVTEVRTNLMNNVPTRIAARAKTLRKESALKSLVKSEIRDALEALSKADPANVARDLQ